MAIRDSRIHPSDEKWKKDIDGVGLSVTLIISDFCLMMDYLRPKFQQIRVIFWGERAKKPPKRAHFMAAALLRNNLKIYNFGTINAILMKLTTIMYVHETFHLGKN